jgi:hypothetical protein
VVDGWEVRRLLAWEPHALGAEHEKSQEEPRMVNRLFGGNGSGKGVVLVSTQGPGWAVVYPSPNDPPPPDQLPYHLSLSLEKWLKERPGVRVRTTLPIVKDGDTIGIHVWYDGG